MRWVATAFGHVAAEGPRVVPSLLFPSMKYAYMYDNDAVCILFVVLALS